MILEEKQKSDPTLNVISKTDLSDCISIIVEMITSKIKKHK